MKTIYTLTFILFGCCSLYADSVEVLESNCHLKNVGEWCGVTVRITKDDGRTFVMRNDYTVNYKPKNRAERDKMTFLIRQIKLYPDDPTAWFNFGKFNYEISLRGDNNRLYHAIPAFEKAAELNPTDGEIHFYLGLGFVQKGHIKNALEHFDSAITYTPTHYKAYTERGWLRFLLKQTALADADFDKALQLAPNAPDAHLGKAAFLLEQHNPQEAMQIYNRAPQEGSPLLLSHYTDTAVFANDVQNYLHAVQQRKLDNVNAYKQSAIRSISKKPYSTISAESCMHSNPYDEECPLLYAQGAVKYAWYTFNKQQKERKNSSKQKTPPSAVYRKKSPFNNSDKANKKQKHPTFYRPPSSFNFAEEEARRGIARLEDAMKEVPQYAPAFYEYAKLQTLRGEYGKALKALEEYLEKEPNATLSKKEIKFWKKAFKKKTDDPTFQKIKEITGKMTPAQK